MAPTIMHSIKQLVIIARNFILSMGSPDKFSRSAFIIDNSHKLLQAEYDVEPRTLGSGTYGSVSRGVCKKSGVTRAIKTIPKSQVKNIPRFRTEIQIMKGLDHPNIVKLFEIFEDVKNIYLIMELCTGGELFDRIINDGSFSEAQAAHIMKDVVSALNYMHQHNIMHRDLKPENLLFLNKNKDSPIKVIDFGLATSFEPGAHYDMKAGTPYYVAPQILEGFYNFKCDIWSCGVIAYVMLCGYPPFHGSADNEILARVKIGKYSFPDGEWANISPDAKDLINNMLRFDPERRFTAEQCLQHRWLKNVSASSELPKTLYHSLKVFRAQTKFKKIALTVIAQQMNESNIEILRKAFVALDANGDGHLTCQEIKEGMTSSGLEIANDIEELLCELDTDGSGKVDYTEFIAATIDRRLYIEEDICWAAFRVFDLDGNGRITKRELQTVLSNNAVANTVGHAQAEAILREADLNGDGEVDFEEFMMMMKKSEPSSPVASL